MTDNGRKLPTKKARAISALLSCRTVEEAAKQAKVGERTLHRWLTDPTFKAHLARAEGALIDGATRRLLRAQERAVSTLEEILQDSEARPSVRLRAAQIVIDAMLKLRELRNIEARLQVLEEAYGQKS